MLVCSVAAMVKQPMSIQLGLLNLLLVLRSHNTNIYVIYTRILGEWLRNHYYMSDTDLRH